MRVGCEKSVRRLRSLWMETLAMLTLSFQPSLRTVLFLEALAFPLPPAQDVFSAAGTANRRYQSHWLRNNSLPISPLLWRQLLELVSQICSSVCSASKGIYTVKTTHTDTKRLMHTKFCCHFARTKKHSCWICHCPAFYIPLSMQLAAELHRQNPPHVLHVSWT